VSSTRPRPRAPVPWGTTRGEKKKAPRSCFFLKILRPSREGGYILNPLLQKRERRERKRVENTENDGCKKIEILLSNAWGGGRRRKEVLFFVGKRKRVWGLFAEVLEQEEKERPVIFGTELDRGGGIYTKKKKREGGSR